MTVIPKEELDRYQFNFLPDNLYVEVDAFTLLGRRFKIIMAVPKESAKTGKTSSYAVLMHMPGAGVVKIVGTTEMTDWIICPWLSAPILEKLSMLVPPDVAVMRMPDEMKELLKSTPQAAVEVPGPDQSVF